MRRAPLTLLALAATPAVAVAETVEAESLALAGAAGAPYADASAGEGRALLMWANGVATGSPALATGASELVVRVRGDQCGGSPAMTVTIDGRDVLAARPVAATTWSDVPIPVALSPGTHAVSVAFVNDARTRKCDRNLRVDRLVFTPVPGPPPPVQAPTASPFAGATLWVDPASDARGQADAWRATRPADAAAMDRIAGASQADWFGGWSGDITAAVDARVTQITAAGALPVLVAYDIPQRDCGSYSAGGQGSPEAYRAWIRAFAAGIGARPAAVTVILEPDALSLTVCLSAADVDTRYALLVDAVSVLAARPGVAVYLDAGNSDWHAAGEAATRLRRAGVEGARGFALNVSNYNATPVETAYGGAISDLVGGKPFVVDTSRNGLGGTGEWCNVPDRALGAPAGSAPPDPRVDALLWVKRPGESDGTSNGGPAAGAWWPEYALGLAQRAAQERSPGP